MAKTTKKAVKKITSPKAAKTVKATKTAKTTKVSRAAKPGKAVKVEKVSKVVPAVSAIPVSPLTFEKPAKFEQVNHSLTKIDAMGLVCGAQKYVADVDFKDLLHIKVLGSPHAHAEIKKIDTSAALKVEGVVAIYTYKDVPRVVRTTAGQGFPEPSPYDTCLLDHKVRFVGDRVAIVDRGRVAAILFYFSNALS